MLRSVSILLFLLVLLGACNEDEPETPPTTVSDADGNIYNTVTIGTQTWITENLKTTKLNDGTPIPLVIDTTEWLELRTPGYCWYGNDQATYGETYGALYNWYTVSTNRLCPVGWHVPTSEDKTTLGLYLGGTSVAGAALKEVGTLHWLSPNEATNETGFTALPGGARDFRKPPSDSHFWGVGGVGRWWERGYSPDYWYPRHFTLGSGSIMGGGQSNYFGQATHGHSVRCIWGDLSKPTHNIGPQTHLRN